MGDKEEASPGSKVQRITEGTATIEKIGNEVFYNKAQATNRDLSVAILKHFVNIRKSEIESGTLKPNKPLHKPVKNSPPLAPFLENHQSIEGIKVFEGLAASGLRSIRYAKEVAGIGAVVACDLDGHAVECIKKHADQNGVADKVYPLHADARIHMYQHPAFYDVVDLDPYGTPVQLLDSAVQAVSEGGLLCVTATDLAVLCGSTPEVCYTKYQSISLKRGYCHEMAIRILLQSISNTAARYKRNVVPVLSMHVDFYVRVFVRVYTSAQASKFAPTKLAHVYQSTACDSFYFQPICLSSQIKGKSDAKFTPTIAPVVPERCPETGSGFLVGGPIWIDPLHDPAWIKEILGQVKSANPKYTTQAKLTGLLTTISEELLDAPLYVDLHALCKTVRANVPKINHFTSAIAQQGFRVSLTHCNPKAFKTDAPFDLIWDILRTWLKEQKQVKIPSSDSAIGRLLSKDIKYKDIKFSNRPVSSARKAGVARFVQNPARWGPMARHGRKTKLDQAAETSPNKKAKNEDSQTTD